MTTNFEDFDEEQLRQLALSLDRLSDGDDTAEITNDDELHVWIKEELGIDIPRKAVCPDHNAPFEVIADLFFNRVSAAILVANRGGGKTKIAACWQFCNMRWIPEVECASVGAIDIQAKRAYQYFKDYQARAGEEFITESLISETRWTQGQKYEILTGSLKSVNGPHPQKVHRDEVELMDMPVFQESLQMEKSKTTSTGKLIPRQTLITSTRKTSTGIMQGLMDSVKLAEKQGRKPPYKVYIFCIKETIQNQAHCCQVFNPDLEEGQRCDCDKIQNDEWAEGEPRLFTHICGGSLARADGFIPLDDAQNTFITSSKAVWEAQQECKRPYAEDITLSEFTREKHCIYDFEPDPENGLIFQSLDVGGSSPHAVEWGQLLDYEMEVTGYNGEKKRIPEGSLVIFDELYIADIGNETLADMIVERESQWRTTYPEFKIHSRFIDPQAKITRLDFRSHIPSLPSIWPAVTRDREEHLKRIRERISKKRFYVCIDRVEMFVEEVELWNINVARKKFDHAVDSTLYMASNVHMLIEKGFEKGGGDPHAKLVRRVGGPNPFKEDEAVPASMKSPLHQSSDPELQKEVEWRKKFAPVGP